MSCALAVPDGTDVTDARLPDRWLMNKRLMTLPDDAFKLYVVGLMMSVSNRADGRLDKDDLNMMFCESGPELRDELVRRDLWAVEGDGWMITDFPTTQTSAAQLVAYEQQAIRDRDRKRERRKPAGAKSADSPAERRTDGGPPTKDRTGKASTGREVDKSQDEQFPGSYSDHVPSPRQDAFAVESEEWEREWGPLGS